MTQVKSINGPKSKLARTLGALEGQNYRRWEPDRDLLMKCRQLSRADYTARQAFEELKPDCCFNTFQKKMKTFSIVWGTGGYRVGSDFYKRQGK